MKKIVALLALMAFVPAAHADNHESNSEVSTSGHFRARYQLNMDADMDADDGASSEAGVYTRFGFASTFRASEKVSAHLGLMHKTQMGADKQHNNRNTEASALWADEAYGSWMASDTLSLKVGRFHVDFGNQSVLSSNDYEQVPYSLEGLAAGIDTGFAGIGVLALKLADAGTGTGDTDADVETNLYGVTFDLKNMPEVAKNINFHVIQVNGDEASTTATGDGAETDMRYGLTVAGEIAGAFYDFTYNAHAGEERDNGTKIDTEGNMMDITLGYGLPDVMGLKFWVNHHTDTGDDATTTDKKEGYDSFLYYKHGNAGYMDAVSWGNLTNMSLNFSMEPMENMSLEFNYHTFTKTEVAAGAKDDLGTEMDLSLNKKYEDNFSIGARYSQFAPGDATKVDGDTASQLWIQGSMTF